MNFLKKNLKWIITIIGVIIVTTGISVYATGQYLASQVDYNKNGQAKVSDALDDLYNKSANYVLPAGTKTINTNGEFNVAEFEKVLVEGFDCTVMTNFQIQAGSNAIHYNIGFNPRLVFMVTSDNKFYWGIGNNQYWYVNSSNSGILEGTFESRDNGFTFLSNTARTVTLYAIK